MRIRKRPIQQTFSSISPLSSDPNFNKSPVVQHPQRWLSPPPSDQPSHPIRRQKPTQDLDSSAVPETTTIRATHGKELKKKEDHSVLKQTGEDERGENGEKRSNYTTRKKSVSGEELGRGSLSHQAEGSWCEGEKAFPLKKIRIMKKDNDNNNEKSGKKFRSRNGALMEGSRCSRVNGRGWRCCQQTLVGYSLCEHHLGKGRLRSIASVKSNAAKKEDPQPPLSKQGSDQKTVMKLGTVKARSISSLLGQNDNVIAVSDDD
ncbi:hypothetical protein F3Y22_tig00110213pilonHSYRG00032 [Hibiscus syriacus]|uniref:WRC domain-containing protein n=1 Tax=Hibiscus syriacus TaxID=106335 RepID=A0A6A3BEF9_HIBSY|nr:uncharacterized protein LOC120113646 [Hibiscus syriacus]KAE8713159.1 hypothetical protein F3Y22_tig00110213pilonHSYRG00032 [Hibiscus syriacus]